MINDKLPVIWYGGDYNPEQFDLLTLQDDIVMLKKAHINVATIGVFSWALLQVDEDKFTFTWLDTIIDTLYESGIYTCLATPTAVPPAWMVKLYPDLLRTDQMGIRKKFGGRANACPTSENYRRFTYQIAGQLAKRYAQHPGVLMFHISNEYADACYCDRCEIAFRQWLKDKYQTIEAVNHAWNTTFWGHTFQTFDEIVIPDARSEQWSDRATNFQSMSLDFKRFSSESLFACYQNEVKAIREFSNLPVTTNLMGAYKPLDYSVFAKGMDVISWDNYPSHDATPSEIAFSHDLMRGLKAGKPFMLMEQTPSQQNWQPYNALKRPGVMRLWSYQAIAHGADTVMFFQLRRSVGACEKFHGAVIDHVGHENTRVFQEVAILGEELARLGLQLLDTRLTRRVGILFDWENWWAVEFSSGPSQDLWYRQEIQKYYDAFHQQGIAVDIVFPDQDFSEYAILVAPVLYMMKPGLAARLKEFVRAGSTFMTTFMSGLVDEHDRIVPGGYPGELRDLLGIWVEEFDALPPGVTNRMVCHDDQRTWQERYACSLLCDVIHTTGADVLFTYERDFYKNYPVVTRHRYGDGNAWYVGSSPEPAFLYDLVANLCREKGIVSALSVPEGVEITQRTDGKITYLFVLNHADSAVQIDLGSAVYQDILKMQTVTGKVMLASKDVWVLRS